MREAIGIGVLVLAVSGVWLNNHRIRACFLLWLVSNLMSFGLHAHAEMWSLAARDGAFFLLAIHGWRKWGKESP